MAEKALVGCGLRQELSREHRMVLHRGLSDGATIKGNVSDSEASCKTTCTGKMSQASLDSMKDISLGGKDAPRKFCRYLGTLNGADRRSTTLHEDAGLPTERL